MIEAANDNASGIRFLSVCSGIEAASCAWHPLGWRAVAFSEIEKFPSAVLAHHYPDVPNLGDFTKIDTTTLGRVDILAGGTPCQAFSVAGLRKGLEDARGNLTLKFVELAHALADGNGLRNVVWENVVGVLSDKGNAFGCFLGGLVGADSAILPNGRWTNAGMVSGPKGRAAWIVKDAQYFRVAQRRRRVLVVADFGNGADPAAVLFEPESVPRHSPPSREAGKGVAADVAPSLVRSGRGVERPGDTRGQDPVVAMQWPADVASTLNAAFGEKLGLENQHINSGAPLFVPHAIGIHGDIAHTLKAEGADASEDGTGRGTPVIATATSFARQSSFADQGSEEVSGTLIKNQTMAVAMTVAIRGRDGGATAELGGDVDTALRASQGGGDKPHVLAWQPGNVTRGAGSAPNEDVFPTLKSDHGRGISDQMPHVLATSAVRRLTPVECERLQGFPDGYTDIPWRGKPNSPDGPRYKALGNSWAVPKFVWLGRRIAALMPANDNYQSEPVARKVSHA